MTPATTVTRYCEGRTRRGTLCKREAGWGTDHPGRGRCKLHGGKTRSHVRKAAREEAHEFVIGQLGYEMDISPLDGALMAVRMAAGASAYWKARLAQAHREGRHPTSVEREGYRIAMADLGRMSDNASKAGVAERLIAITERMAEQITLAFEEALQVAKVDAAARMLAVKTFAEALGRLERDDPMLPMIESHAREAHVG